MSLTAQLSSAQTAASHFEKASKTVPNAEGRFGPYGGSYVPETLMVAVRQLAEEYERAKKDPEFKRQLNYYLKQFVARPTPRDPPATMATRVVRCRSAAFVMARA